MRRWPVAVVGVLGLVAVASPNMNCGGSSTATAFDASPAADAATQNDADVPEAGGDGAVACDPGIPAASSDWPGWQRMTEVDPCCIADVPVDLSTAVVPLAWTSCSDAGDCFDLNTPPVDGIPRLFIADVTRDQAGAPKYLLFGRGLDAYSTSAEWALYSLGTGAPVAAWRAGASKTNCSVFVVNASRDKASIVLRQASTGALRLATGDPATLMHAPEFHTLTGLEKLYWVQETALSTSLFAFDLVPSGIIFRAALNAGTYVSSQGQQPVSPLILDFAEGDDVYALSEHGTAGYQQEYRILTDGTAALYRSVPSADVSAFRTDGTSMFWAETHAPVDAGAQTSIEIWAAPYTADPATLTANAHRVASVTGAGPPQDAIAFNGLYATRTGTNVVVVRLSDGTARELVPPAGYDFWKLSLITPTEFWVVLAKTAGARGVALRRIGLASW